MGYFFDGIGCDSVATSMMGDSGESPGVGWGVDLTIIEASRGTSEQVTVPTTVATERIIGRLAQVWQLPTTDQDGRALSYRFEDPRTGRPIDPSVTLADAGVSQNDVLRLSASTADATSPAIPVPARSVFDRPATAQSSASPALADLGASHEAPALLPRRGRVSAPLAFALVGVLVCIAAGVAIASGVFSGSPKKPVPVATLSASPRQGAAVPQGPPSEAQRSSDREAIMSLLGSYQQAYSNHDVEGLESLLTQSVKRHGLAKGGCTVSEGMSPVLASYQSQFEAGSGTYSLVGLSEQQIQIDTGSQAHLAARYTITPGGSGYVNFKFNEEGGAWKINEVDAACH